MTLEQTVKYILWMGIALVVIVTMGCERSSNEQPAQVQTCTIVDSTMICPDGTEYELPEVIEEPIEVITDPAPDNAIEDPVEEPEEDKPKYVCQKHKKKHKRILCRIIRHWHRRHR